MEVTTEPRTDGGNHPITIVIPAYNEAASIESVLEALPNHIRGYPIEAIVVSDGSDDDTATRAAEAGATVAEHPINQGQGGALQTGFLVAKEKNAEVVVTMDADIPSTSLKPSSCLYSMTKPITSWDRDIGESTGPRTVSSGSRESCFSRGLLIGSRNEI